MICGIDAKAEREEAAKRVDELDRFIETGKVSGRYYYSCILCGRLCERVMNEWSKHDLCRDCWEAKEIEKSKREMENLVGYRVADFKVEKAFDQEKPVVSELTLKKGDRKVKLALHHDPIIVM